jgi:hypothetical protein
MDGPSSRGFEQPGMRGRKKARHCSGRVWGGSCHQDLILHRRLCRDVARPICVGPFFAPSGCMTTCRSVRLIGAIYFLMCLIGTLVHSLPTSVFLLLLHLMIGIWAILASQDRVSAVRFSRKAAVVLSLLALVEFHVPLPTLLLPWSPVGSDVPILHLTTALVAAYFGYYWTDAVVEADRREATKTG